MIARRRQRAGGVIGEGAGRAIGAVEIERDLVILRKRGFEKAPSWVGCVAGSLVAKDEEQLVVLSHGVQAVLVAIEYEGGIAWAEPLLGFTQNIRHWQRARRIVRHKAGAQAVRFADRVPAPAGERCARRA